MDLIDDILQVAQGDMRRAVTTLQSIHALAAGGSKSSSSSITLDQAAVAEIAGLPPQVVINELYASLVTSKHYVDMQAAVEQVIASGYSAQLMLGGLLDKIRDDTVLNDFDKANVSICMAEAEKNMVEGADEELQLMRVCSMIWTSFARQGRD
jgi:replication factor C subunit 2/4